jgi:hypothetical protein
MLIPIHVIQLGPRQFLSKNITTLAKYQSKLQDHIQHNLLQSTQHAYMIHVILVNYHYKVCTIVIEYRLFMPLFIIKPLIVIAHEF